MLPISYTKRSQTCDRSAVQLVYFIYYISCRPGQQLHVWCVWSLPSSMYLQNGIR